MRTYRKLSCPTLRPLNNRCASQHIDAAFCYDNEESVGKALGEYLRAGRGSREDLFVTTKLWSQQKGHKEVEPAVKEALSKLQVDYLDLLLIHWPVTNKSGPDLQPSTQVSPALRCSWCNLTAPLARPHNHIRYAYFSEPLARSFLMFQVELHE